MTPLVSIEVFLSDEISDTVGVDRRKLWISVKEAVAKDEKVSWLEKKLRTLMPLPSNVVFLTSKKFAIPPTEPLALLTVESCVWVKEVNWSWGEHTEPIEPLQRVSILQQNNLNQQIHHLMPTKQSKDKNKKCHKTAEKYLENSGQYVDNFLYTHNGTFNESLNAQVTKITSKSQADVNEEMEVVDKEKEKEIDLQREKQRALQLLEQIGCDDVTEGREKDEMDGPDWSNESHARAKKRRRVRKRRRRPSESQMEIQTEEQNNIRNGNGLEHIHKLTDTVDLRTCDNSQVETGITLSAITESDASLSDGTLQQSKLISAGQISDETTLISHSDASDRTLRQSKVTTELQINEEPSVIPFNDDNRTLELAPFNIQVQNGTSFMHKSDTPGSRLQCSMPPPPPAVFRGGSIERRPRIVRSLSPQSAAST